MTAPARILVSGASGLIGSAFTAACAAAGSTVVRLVRRAPAGGDEIPWDPGAGRLDPRAIDGVDAVVHLSGESIASGRWSRGRVRRIRDSRLDATRLLSRTLARLERPPRVLISASAVGYYGNRGDETLVEESAPGRGFLAEVARDWEAATETASASGIRVVHARHGMVLSRGGGALEPLHAVFRLGLGGTIGDGRAWWSWVAIDDVVGAYRWAIGHDDARGAMNVTAPRPVRNVDFTRALARVLSRPAPFRVPAVALRLRFGGMADEVLLSSARVEPARLLSWGYRFQFPDLDQALSALFDRSARNTRSGAMR